MNPSFTFNCFRQFCLFKSNKVADKQLKIYPHAFFHFFKPRNHHHLKVAVYYSNVYICTFIIYVCIPKQHVVILSLLKFITMASYCLFLFGTTIFLNIILVYTALEHLFFFFFCLEIARIHQGNNQLLHFFPVRHSAAVIHMSPCVHRHVFQSIPLEIESRNYGMCFFQLY